MLKKLILLPISMFFAVALSGCSQTIDEPEVHITAPEQMYQNAQEALDTGNMLKATRILEALESRYPFGHKLCKCS